MRRFSFRFQRLLELKESVEEARRIALGEVVAVLNREREYLEGLEQTRARYREAAAALPADRLDASLLALNSVYLLRLQREIGEQGEQIARVEELVEEKRQELVEARKERRVYEILKDRAREAHRRERNRQERLVLDQVGQDLYRQRQAQG